jgi:translation elongation factor EF-1alpha
MVKKTTAFNNLQSKMIALETINATKATSEAITRATMLHNENIAQNEYTNIRIANLEKSFRRQEHKTNEIANKLSPNSKHKGQQLNKNKKQQKNYSGSQLSESLDSLPTKPLEHSNHPISQGLVDLTSNDKSCSHAHYKNIQKSLFPPQHHPKGNKKDKEGNRAYSL